MSYHVEKSVAILGSRGIPAKHGGFETFVEHLAPFLVKQGWKVKVYCQYKGTGPLSVSEYQDVELVHVPVKSDSPIGTIIFDWKSTVDACRHDTLLLTLGYNTGFLALYCRLMKKINIINMDGIEWKRGKWSRAVRGWFYLNERIACWAGNHLIADHPDIKTHLGTRVRTGKISMIPYGADFVESADMRYLDEYHVVPNEYVILIARPEPENSILEIVQAFSRKRRNCFLVVLGSYQCETNDYHRSILNAASDEVKFIGAVYDTEKVRALRFYSRLYIHGHTVGGTNPSLVEALGAGCPILAHDNKFNRWVTDNRMQYFSSVDDCDKVISHLLSDDSLLEEMRLAGRNIFNKLFGWENILGQYENLLEDHISESGRL